MFFRVFMSALIAGVLAGLIVSAVQMATTTPLILEAEKYETAAQPHPPGALSGARTADHGHAPAPGNGVPHDHGDGWAPAVGIERTLFTALTNIVAGFGFALLIAGGFALSRRPVDTASGLLWGLAGFATFTLAPGLGLPPELPGMATAGLAPRQGWWLFAAAATALGLTLIVFRRSWPVRLAGALALILPHAVGAPHPPAPASAVPPELAAQFVSASIVTAAVFWLLLGAIAATAWRRLGRSDG